MNKEKFDNGLDYMQEGASKLFNVIDMMTYSIVNNPEGITIDDVHDWAMELINSSKNFSYAGREYARASGDKLIVAEIDRRADEREAELVGFRDRINSPGKTR